MRGGKGAINICNDGRIHLLEKNRTDIKGGEMS